MNKKRLFVIMSIVLLTVATFISCNSEIDEGLPRTSVSFAPSVSKALNQQGSSVDFSKNVADYHWKYYCSTVDGTPSEDEWREFPDAQTGLGTIKDLYKGDSYYFGLRGYTTGTSYTDKDLIWEGFHYSDDGKTPAAVKLNAKNQLVTIDVYTKGLGYLYFSISSPNESLFIMDGDTGKVKAGYEPDRFAFSYESLDGKTTGTDYLTATSYNTNTNYWIYEDEPGTPNRSLPSGTYLFSIKQQTWDNEKPAGDGYSFGDYVDVEERAQILIVNIVSGVDTVIAGSLDSRGIVPFDYYGYSDDIKHGLQLSYHQKTESVSKLSVTAKNNQGDLKYIFMYDRLYVSDSDYVLISTEVEDGAQLRIYINGEQLLTETDSDGYYILPDEDQFVKPGSGEAGFEHIMAYGRKGNDYLVTITYNEESMTFTVIGINENDKSVATGILTSGSNKVYLETSGAAHITVTAEVPNSAAQNILEELTEGYATTETDNKLTLSLSVFEKEKTETYADFDISMSALAEVFTNGVKTFSTESDISTLDSYVDVSITLDSYLKDVSVQHNEIDMIEWTSTSNIQDATEADDINNVGFYKYDSQTGILYVRTKSFSPYRIRYSKAVYYTVNYHNGVNLWKSVKVVENSKAEKLYLSKTNGEHCRWMKSEADDAEVFDFNSLIITDTDIWADWFRPTVTIYLDNEVYVSFTDWYENSLDLSKIPVESGKIITSVKYENNQDWDFENDTIDRDLNLYITISDIVNVTFGAATKINDLDVSVTQVGAGSKIILEGFTTSGDIVLKVGLQKAIIKCASGKSFNNINIVPISSSNGECLTSVGQYGTVNTSVTVTYYYDCTVTYEIDKGTSYTDVVVVSAQQVTQPEDPAIDGRIFLGWYSDAAYTSEYDFASYVYDDITIYAKWAGPGKYNVNFNKNSSEAQGSQDQITDVLTNIESTLPYSTFTRAGYTFKEWTTSSDGKGTSYTSGSTITTPEVGTIELYAQWTPNTYSVVFDGNQKTGGSMANQTHTYDSQKALTSNGYSRTGYTFASWNSKSDGSGTSYSDGQNILNLTSDLNGSVTLYAQWTPNTYSVVFDGNQKTGGSMANQTHTYDSEKTLTSNGYSRTGYTFAGWNTKSDGSGTSYSNGQSVKNLTSELNGTVTLYAKWTGISYTVKFNGNGNTGGSMSNQAQVYGTAKALTDNGFTKTGYTFAGWNTKSDGSGTSYSNKQSVSTLTTTAGTTVNLYAKWTANTYYVEFNSNASSGVSGSTAKETFTYNVSKKLTANGFTRSGYKFNGWNTKADGSGTSYANEASVKNLTSTAGGTVKLYAQWLAVVKVYEYTKSNEQTGYSFEVSFTPGTTWDAFINNDPTAGKYTFSSLGSWVYARQEYVQYVQVCYKTNSYNDLLDSVGNKIERSSVMKAGEYTFKNWSL